METTRKCPYCGEEIMADARKCRHCGEWLIDEAEPKKESEILQTKESVANPKAKPESGQVGKKGRAKSNKIWLVVIAAVAAIALAVGALFWSGLSDSGNNTTGLMTDVEEEEIGKQVLEAYKNGTIYNLMTPEFKSADEAAEEAEAMFGEIFHDADIFYNTQDEMPNNIVVSEVNLLEKDVAHVTVSLGFDNGYTNDIVLVMVKNQNVPNGEWLVDDVWSYSVNDRGERVLYSQKNAMNEFVNDALAARAYVEDESESDFSYEVDETGNEYIIGEDGIGYYRGNVNDDNEDELEEIEINVEPKQNEVVNEYMVPENEVEEEEEAEVFTIVDEMPQFPGGESKLMEYVSKNINYPQIARESGIQGRVFVGFVVEPDGSISNVKLLRGIGGGCDEEALRVVNSLPKWKPGKNRGKAVRVSYQIPVFFKLQ